MANLYAVVQYLEELREQQAYAESCGRSTVVKALTMVINSFRQVLPCSTCLHSEKTDATSQYSDPASPCTRCVAGSLHTLAESAGTPPDPADVIAILSQPCYDSIRGDVTEVVELIGKLGAVKLTSAKAGAVDSHGVCQEAARLMGRGMALADEVMALHVVKSRKSAHGCMLVAYSGKQSPFYDYLKGNAQLISTFQLEQLRSDLSLLGRFPDKVGSLVPKILDTLSAGVYEPIKIKKGK
jgi:hypothetical protein